MLELIATYIFSTIWALSIAIITLLIFVIFLKRDVNTKLKLISRFKELLDDLVLFKNSILSGPIANEIEKFKKSLLDRLGIIEESQEKRDETLTHIIQQHNAFFKIMECIVREKNIEGLDELFNDIARLDNDDELSDKEKRLLISFRKQEEESKKKRLFDSYDEKRY